MKASAPINLQSTATGLAVRKVIIEQIVPERGVAIVSDRMNYTTEVSYRVQRAKGRIPRVGDVWYIDRLLGPWTFAALVVAADADFSTFTETQTFSEGIAIPNTKQVNIGSSFSTASVTAVRAATTDASYSTAVTGDTISRYLVQAGGKVEWGPGASTARDTNLYRSAADTLKTDDSFIVGADLTIGTDVVNTAWTSYTPTWTGSTGSPSLGNGTVSAAYKRIGKTMFFRIHYTFGTTTNFGSGAWAFTIPVAANGVSAMPAVCIQSVGSNRWPATGWISGTTVTRIVAGSGGNAGIGSGSPFAWTDADELVMSGCYETT